VRNFTNYELRGFNAGLEPWKAGAPIPNSRYVRQYCRSCGEAIRVDPEGIGPDWQCEICSGVRRLLMPGGISGPLDPDSGGYQSIARRAMEDGYD